MICYTKIWGTDETQFAYFKITKDFVRWIYRVSECLSQIDSGIRPQYFGYPDSQIPTSFIIHGWKTDLATDIQDQLNDEEFAVRSNITNQMVKLEKSEDDDICWSDWGTLRIYQYNQFSFLYFLEQVYGPPNTVETPSQSIDIILSAAILHCPKEYMEIMDIDPQSDEGKRIIAEYTKAKMLGG